MGLFRTLEKYQKEARGLGLSGNNVFKYSTDSGYREYIKQEHEIKRKQAEMKKQQAEFEANQKRREQESQNQARLSAQLAADNTSSDNSVIQTGGDLLGDTPETGVRRRRRKASGASAVGL